MHGERFLHGVGCLGDHSPRARAIAKAVTQMARAIPGGCEAEARGRRAGSGSAQVSPGLAILATSSRPGRREGELHQDTGAAHDQRRDSVTIAFGRTREKERKSKPSELRRVEWRERGSRCLWCVGAAQDES